MERIVLTNDCRSFHCWSPFFCEIIITKNWKKVKLHKKEEIKG
ncbi:hypothetical protein AR1Y2_2329 [Anaerostipes rhamnosivorans]|uniref:Uncharacterized protein n=1 Tax=Anaerostipes rhamnosivorans TaxID=1229621 RepID=A0A4P8IIH7_9FIRM|nr:hypothetical protein AR1Y2_2329 [Anaerostipes rhamnosivorans]